MPKCPECKKNIKTLDVVTEETRMYSYSGGGEYEYSETIESQRLYWKCPECYKVLDLEPDEVDADEFLNS